LSLSHIDLLVILPTQCQLPPPPDNRHKVAQLGNDGSSTTLAHGHRMEQPVLRKYPRTQHLAGSNLQPGDSDLPQVPLTALAGVTIAVEEKLDGANCAISFDGAGNLMLQSRGHYLVGGPRERHFEQLKSWTAVHQASLYSVLGDRFTMYGEWMATKHTVFYNDLIHLFYEFDVLDTQTGCFLDTPSRHRLLSPVPVVHVPVLFTGTLSRPEHLLDYLITSMYKTSDWRDQLATLATTLGQDPVTVASQTDDSDLAEGLYIKVEHNGVVVNRYKWVRPGFRNTLVDQSGEVTGHWWDRPHLPNLIAAGAELYRPTLTRAQTLLRPYQVL